MIGPRLVGWLNWPFFAWNSCFPETSISGTLHLLYVLLIQLHFVIVKRRIGRNCAKTPFALTAVSSLRARSWGGERGGGGGRKGGLVPQELARSLKDPRNSCIGSTDGTVGLGPGNGRLNREYVIATDFQCPNLYRHSSSSLIFLCFKLIFIH